MRTLVRAAQQLLLLTLLLATGSARAEELTIQITKGVEGAQPIAIVPFGGNAGLPEDIAAIVANDLQRSGRFAPLKPSQFVDRPTDFGQINFGNWRALSVNHLAVGQVRPGPAGYVVQFQLADVFQGGQLLGYSFNVKPNELRRIAHHIADLIYEKLTGEKGVFGTRIAYVTARGESYALIVADYDGYGAQTVLRSQRPIMSPAWSPDGSKLAYVSFETRSSQIIVQDVYTGARQSISASPGINGAPSWSPDGRRLALTLSKDGNPEIYSYDLGSRALARLTSSSAIDTEAAWSPDGGTIVFTSDRGGSPQLYRMPASGGSAERISFAGNYNARPSWSPDGKLALMTRNGSGFRIAVMDPRTRQTRILTDGPYDESPTFAPNGSMVMYAAQRGGRGVLSVVSVDGRVQQNLLSQEGDVREPAWSPAAR